VIEAREFLGAENKELTATESFLSGQLQEDMIAAFSSVELRLIRRPSRLP
jgi:hypothetical protein